MAERDDEPEGWDVRRRPAYLAAALIPLSLLAILSGTGWAYVTYLQPSTREPVTTFPAPGVESFIHDGANDPVRVRPMARADPAVEAAKRAVLANGQSGWRE